MERVEGDADRGAQVRNRPLLAGLEAVAADCVERKLRGLDRVLAQFVRQVDRELVAAETVEVAVEFVHQRAQHATDADQELVADAMTRAGTRVRFEGSIYIPEDEICWFTIAAPTTEEAALVAVRSGLEAVRIVEAMLSGKVQP